jgi:hypothetical protein
VDWITQHWSWGNLKHWHFSYGSPDNKDDYDENRQQNFDDDDEAINNQQIRRQQPARARQG